MSPTTGSDAGAASRLGINKGMVVQELGWDNDVDDELRASLEDAIDADLVDGDYGNVVDVVLLWWRDGDGDLDRDLNGANISPDRLLLWGEYETGPIALRLQAQTYLARDFDGEPAANGFEGYTVLDAVARSSPDVLLRTWMPLFTQGSEQMQQAMAAFFRGLSPTGGAPTGGATTGGKQGKP